jgi:hypothetical protein
VAKIIEQGLGAILAYSAADVDGLSANLFLDPIQGSDASDCFGGSRRGVNHMDVVEFKPGMSPTGDLVNGSIPIKMMQTCIMWCVT